MKKHIPNLITSCNLLCGCIAITEIAQGNLITASLLVLLGAFFDFFDGMAARLLNVGSPMGAELDSLADVVTFGIVPAYLAHIFLIENNMSGVLAYFPFILAAFSAIRLAKFNIDTRQSTSFIGLPTPANALFWISIPLIGWQVEQNIGVLSADNILGFLSAPWFILTASVLFSYLMVAELPLLALKFKNLKWSSNKYRWILILSSVVLLSVLFFAAIPFILILYILLSIVENKHITQHEIQS
ncbi:MAG: CDP-diacylglycerol--serine O-phosphatidyltransferase [Bacteroidetes bacterium]|nr:MAG: CDP-diacylglycerol--serine O-phosphatidyltransferase [Bacteroidota bacterium]MBL1145926.1 CDP-diacylglycerol--serine O-phosphatidyltransferase [Bacteroidota bacterium]NOG58720.1 CDP-diacylglycerol--serine O-phosphatidyltransferase [Bacteroidota bacterium]